VFARLPFGATVLVTLFVVRVGGASDAVSGAGVAAVSRKPVAITVPDCGGVGRPVAEAVHYANVLEHTRRALTECGELASTDDPTVAAEVDVELQVRPDGDVAEASVVTHARVAPAALACFRRTLLRLVFDAPGPAGATVRVALVLGDPPPDPQPPLPFRIDRDVGRRVVGPLPMRLAPTTLAPAGRAARAAARAVEECAMSTPPSGPTIILTQLLVSETGELARIAATSRSAAGEVIARCVAHAPTRAARGRLAHIDLRLAVAPNGTVSVAP